jgi:hypothetical protein
MKMKNENKNKNKKLGKFGLAPNLFHRLKK